MTLASSRLLLSSSEDVGSHADLDRFRAFRGRFGRRGGLGARSGHPAGPAPGPSEVHAREPHVRGLRGDSVRQAAAGGAQV